MSNRRRAEAKSKNKKTPETQAPTSTKRKRGRGSSDDTPRAFKRLMAFTSGQKTRSGLDDGIQKTKKEKAKERARAKEKEKEKEQGQEGDNEEKEKEETANKPEKEVPAVPTIRPGESMSEFSARVDASIPVAGLINKTTRGGKDPLGLKIYRTRKERKMHKLYDQWRAEEKKIQEMKEEELERVAERELEEDTPYASAGGPMAWDSIPKEGKTKSKKKQKRGGKGKDKEEDPWEELRRIRGERKVKLRDVAQAPPTLQKVSGRLPTLT